jgi:Domain of unknown function (DUF6457)
MTAAEWIRAFCDEIDVAAPSEEQMDAVLRLAAVAAHASERTAAPIACWLGGSSGKPLEELIEAAEGLGTGG